MAQQYDSDLLRMIEEAVSAEKKDTARILEHFHECRELGIDILPLDINQSGLVCVYEREQALRLGFSALGYANETALEELLNERQENGAFQSFQDLCERFETKQLPESFFPQCIQAGVFDSLGESRAKLLNGFGLVLQAVQKAKADKAANQISLFAMMPATSQEQALSIKLPEVEAWGEELRIEHEKEVLGFSFTEYLLQLENADSQDNTEKPEAIDNTAEIEASKSDEHDGPLTAESSDAKLTEDGEGQENVPAEDLPPDDKKEESGQELDAVVSATEAHEAEVAPEQSYPESPSVASPEADILPADISSIPEEEEAVPLNDDIPDYLNEPPEPEEFPGPEAYAEAEEFFEPASKQQTAPEAPSVPDTAEASGEQKEEPGRFCLQLSLKNTTKAKLQKLRTLCEHNPGSASLLLEFIDEGGNSLKVQANQKYSVLDCAELRESIQTLFEGAASFLDLHTPT